MQIEVVPLETVVDELDKLMHEYWEATVAGEGMPPLEMNWPEYCQLERFGVSLVMVAREDGKVVGFVHYVLVNHTKHKGIRVAHCDTLAVKVSERGKGVGKALVEAAEQELRGRGINQVLHGFRSVYKTEPLFPKLGYKPLETVYMKVL